MYRGGIILYPPPPIACILHRALKPLESSRSYLKAGASHCPSSHLQSTAYIIPYPQRPQYQFQYQWFLIELELLIFLLTLGATLYPPAIARVRPVALSLLSSALVLVMDNINAVFYLLRNDLAMTLFGPERIKLTQVVRVWGDQAYK